MTQRILFISSISAKTTQVPQFCPVISCWNINIVVSVQCQLPSNKARVVLVVAEPSSETLMLSIMAFLAELELIFELELLSKGSVLKNVTQGGLCCTKVNTSNIHLEQILVKFQGIKCPFKGNWLSTKGIQVAKGLKDKRAWFSCTKLILTWM